MNTEQSMRQPELSPFRHAKAGVTLIELMVVIVIVGLLATIVAINVLPSQDTAMVEKAKADIRVLEQAMEMYKLDNFTYPTTEQGLSALVAAPSGLRQPDRYRQGGYIRRLPDDPWGNPYELVASTGGAPFEIVSYGSDGQPGGDDLAADIISSQQ